MSFNYQDVLAAYEAIKDYVRETTLEQSFYLGNENQKFFFKLESCKRAKSFNCGFGRERNNNRIYYRNY